MHGYCKTMLMGHLGADPKLEHVGAEGQPVTSFDVAVTERWRLKSSPMVKEETNWHHIVVWGDQAKHCCQYLHKGSPVFIEGRLHYRSWEHEGQKHHKTEIVGQRVVFLDSKKSSQAGAREVQGAYGVPPSDGADESAAVCFDYTAPFVTDEGAEQGEQAQASQGQPA
jgi:single-strand DNA-binding protein